MSASRLTAQGKLQAPIPNIIEITPGKRWRVSLMSLSWDGIVQSTAFGRVVYWWDIRALPTWPLPVNDPNAGSIASTGFNWTEPPGRYEQTTVNKGSSGSTLVPAIDSPADYLYPCAIRLELTMLADNPNRFTWYWFAPWDVVNITTAGGSDIDIDSKFRAAVTIGTVITVDGGTP